MTFFSVEKISRLEEEADVIIIEQMVRVAESGVEIIHIVCADTDVFILLLHFYAKLKLTCITMEEQVLTELQQAATIGEHGHMISQLPAAHALSGCGTMAQCFGIGKNTVIKVLNSGVGLHKLGVLSEDICGIIEEATAFMAACYGVNYLVTLNMSEVRGEVLSPRMGRKKLQRLQI